MRVLGAPREVVFDQPGVRQLRDAAIEGGMRAQKQGKLRARLTGQNRIVLAQLASESVHFIVKIDGSFCTDLVLPGMIVRITFALASGPFGLRNSGVRQIHGGVLNRAGSGVQRPLPRRRSLQLRSSIPRFHFWRGGLRRVLSVAAFRQQAERAAKQ